MKKSLLMALCAVFLFAIAGCGEIDSQEVPDSSGTDTSSSELTEPEKVDETTSVGEETDAAQEEEATDPAEQPVNSYVFMNGASFTGMEPVKNETNPDGSYCYESQTSDGYTTITNTAIPYISVPEESREEAFARIMAKETGNEAYEFAFEQAPAMTEKTEMDSLYVRWTEGGNEDTRLYTGLAVFGENFMYLYSFGGYADFFESSDPMYREILNGLELTALDSAVG